MSVNPEFLGRVRNVEGRIPRSVWTREPGILQYHISEGLPQARWKRKSYILR